MQLARTVPLVMAGLGLAGCLNLSRSSTIEALAPDYAQAGHVQEITVSHEGMKTALSPGFDETFRSRVKARLDRCATGPRPLRLEARIDQMNKANVLFTAVVAGRNKVLGGARLVDTASGQTVGEYRIGKTIIGRSLAVLKMARAEEQLSDAFGEELCRQAFPRPRPAAAP